MPRSAFPPFGAVFPRFQYRGIRHGVPARRADRAVPVELGRFLAVIHAICTLLGQHLRLDSRGRRDRNGPWEHRAPRVAFEMDQGCPTCGVNYDCIIHLLRLHSSSLFEIGTTISLTVAALARAVERSETYVRQHIHRKHLVAGKDGRRVYVELDEARRWARQRGLPFAPPNRTSASVAAMKNRTARMTVLAWKGVGDPLP